jgi:hypothetical protein
MPIVKHRSFSFFVASFSPSYPDGLPGWPELRKLTLWQMGKTMSELRAARARAAEAMARASAEAGEDDAGNALRSFESSVDGGGAKGGEDEGVVAAAKDVEGDGERRAQSKGDDEGRAEGKDEGAAAAAKEEVATAASDSKQESAAVSVLSQKVLMPNICVPATIVCVSSYQLQPLHTAFTSFSRPLCAIFVSSHFPFPFSLVFALVYFTIFSSLFIVRRRQRVVRPLTPRVETKRVPRGLPAPPPATTSVLEWWHYLTTSPRSRRASRGSSCRISGSLLERKESWTHLGTRLAGTRNLNHNQLL